MPTELSFGEWMRRRRDVLSLTQPQLGERIGYHEAYVRKIERDAAKPPKPFVQALLNGLEIPPDLRPAVLAFAHQDQYDLALDALIGIRREAPATAKRPGWLPHPPTPFLGRAAEVGRVQNLLMRADNQVNLVTLTGVGGTGKTRVAIEAAANARDAFRDGVWFVELASVTDPALVPSAVARRLGIRALGATSLRDALLNHLEDRRLLLVLDNFEHLLPQADQEDLDPAREFVRELRHYCDHLKLLVTSRIPLNLRGERVLVIPPLEQPDWKRPVTLEMLEKNPAVTLFLARAKEVSEDFELSNQNAHAIAEICARLDGLPLAIELVAPRVTVMSPQAIRDALAASGLEFMRGGPDDLERRHKTMSRAIAWSYWLLDGPGQRLLRRLAVFAGGCTLSAAQAVIGDWHGDLTADAPPVSLDAVEAAITHLARHHLVEWRSHGDNSERRVAMLETIREYALGELKAGGEFDLLRQRHALYYISYSEQEASLREGPVTPAALARLEREHSNLRAVQDWCLIETREIEPGLRLAEALAGLWYVHGHLAEGRVYLERFLAQVGQDDLHARSRALHLLGLLTHHQCDYNAARTYFEEVLSLHRQLDRPRSIVAVLNNLAVIDGELGNYTQARKTFEECLALANQINYTQMQIYARNNLGLMDYKLGLPEQARRWYREALTLAEGHTEERGKVRALLGLSQAEYRLGDSATSRTYLQLCLDKLWQLGEKRTLAQCLEWGAEFALELGQLERAARLTGAAEALRQETGAPLPPAEQSDYERLIQALSERLRRVDLQSLQSAGRTMSLTDIINEAKKI